MNKNIIDNLSKTLTAIPVSEIMVKNIKTLHESDTAQKAVNLMAQHSIAGIIIVDKKNKPTGIVTEGDLIKKVFHKNKNSKKILLKNVMSKKLLSIKPSINIGQASALMNRHNISKLPVMENNKIVGYVTKSDLVHKLNDIYKQNRKIVLMAIMIAFQFILISVLLVMYLNK